MLIPTGNVSTAARPALLESNAFQSGVLLRLNAPIEDLRGHGEAAVERLRKALAAGVPFIKDRKRARYYEIHVETERFYIHVLRDAAKVLLLARWEEERV
jgi:hypothetical protein